MTFKDSELGKAIGGLEANQETMFLKIGEVKAEVKEQGEAAHKMELRQQKRYDELVAKTDADEKELKNHQDLIHLHDVKDEKTMERIKRKAPEIATGTGLVTILLAVIELIRRGGI